MVALRKLGLFFCGGLLAAAIKAAPDDWISIGSNGQAVTSILAAPSDPAVLYAATSTSLFRTEDGGANWIEISRGLPAGPPAGFIWYLPLAVDPLSASTLYLSALVPAIDLQHYFPALYKTADGGQTWANIGTGSFRNLAIDGRTGNVYAATELGVLRSVDEGKTWAIVYEGSAGAVAIDPSTSTVYASVYDEGFLKSTDDGINWVVMSFQRGSFDRLIVAPGRPSTIYATVTGIGLPFTRNDVSHIFRSDDGGATWTACTPFLFLLTIQGMAADPASPRTLYFLSGGLLYRSLDGGEHFKAIPLPGPFNYLSAFDLSPDGSILYAGAGTAGAFKLVLSDRPFSRSSPRTIEFR